MINIAQPDDGPSILRLTQAVAVFNDEEVQCVGEIWEAYLSQGPAKSGYNIIVYRDSDEVVGFACFGPHALTDGTFDFYWLAVDPRAQGRGIGQALIAATERGALEQQARILIIETSSTLAYEPARRLYSRCGYTLEATVHDFYAEGDDMVIYTKALHAKH
jgi:ribosomal protein S18 acetylase RimI-like enzyme